MSQKRKFEDVDTDSSDDDQSTTKKQKHISNCVWHTGEKACRVCKAIVCDSCTASEKVCIICQGDNPDIGTFFICYTCHEDSENINWVDKPDICFGCLESRYEENDSDDDEEEDKALPNQQKQKAEEKELHNMAFNFQAQHGDILATRLCQYIISPKPSISRFSNIILKIKSDQDVKIIDDFTKVFKSKLDSRWILYVDYYPPGRGAIVNRGCTLRGFHWVFIGNTDDSLNESNTSSDDKNNLFFPLKK